MSAAADSSAAPPPPAPSQQQDESMTEDVHNPSASAGAAGADEQASSARIQDVVASRDNIERDVSNILAGLNQEQIASIVAAARASEARGQSSSSAENPELESASSSNNPLSHLGQAASTLSSIANLANGFKKAKAEDQSHHNPEEGDAPPPPGTEFQSATTSHPREAGDNEEEEDPQTSAAIAAVKSATDSATAAAIASLGSLASSSTSHIHNAHQEPYSPSPSSSPAGTSRPLKRSRADGGGAHSNSQTPTALAPELDRQRKDNHKEVERRRRSAINDGITQLSHIVPGCDAKNTNKGAIIHAAVRYIQDLKHNEASNIEKWTLEKLLMDQAMGDLSTQLDEVRRENDKLRAELEAITGQNAETEQPQGQSSEKTD